MCYQPRATGHAPGCGADTAFASSQRGIDGAARKPRQIAVQFSQGEIDEMVANARKWMSGPEGTAELKTELTETALVLLQIKKKLALSPPAERSGVGVQSKAVMDYMKLAELMMALLAGEAKKGEEVDAA
jgi:hypothetical protein